MRAIAIAVLLVVAVPATAGAKDRLADQCQTSLIELCVHSPQLPSPDKVRALFTQCKPVIDRTPGPPATFAEFEKACVELYNASGIARPSGR